MGAGGEYGCWWRGIGPGLILALLLLDIILILSNLEIIWKSTNKQAKFSVGIFENFSTNCEITKSLKIDESLIVH